MCVFGIGRTTYTANSQPSIEGVVGLIWQIDSPEKTYAQNARHQVQIQQESLDNQTNLTLVEKLSEAIEINQRERINALAIILAKRLGYSNHRQYLAEVFNISTVRNANTQIDVPINY